ncbi:unnamed protein product, partial [Urochloa humidicola]
VAAGSIPSYAALLFSWKQAAASCFFFSREQYSHDSLSSACRPPPLLCLSPISTNAASWCSLDPLLLSPPSSKPEGKAAPSAIQLLPFFSLAIFSPIGGHQELSPPLISLTQTSNNASLSFLRDFLFPPSTKSCTHATLFQSSCHQVEATSLLLFSASNTLSECSTKCPEDQELQPHDVKQPAASFKLGRKDRSRTRDARRRHQNRTASLHDYGNITGGTTVW